MKLLQGLTEGQVLQRRGSKGARAELSGTTAETGPVTATLSGPRGPLPGWKKRAVGRAARGRFRARLEDVPTGGPYRLELGAGRASARVDSFFVGDVWVLAGQSNMEGCGDMEGAATPHPSIRAFSLRREWRIAADPLHVLPESPDSCHAVRQCAPEEGEALRRRAAKGVGAGLFFAREMRARSGAPQGLVCASHGGTSMRQWDPAGKSRGGVSLYGSLLLSVRATGQPVAGVLWYQGESDANPGDAALYSGRMRRLVAASRRDLRQPGLPWVIVQLARVFGSRADADIEAWNRVQEEQRLLPGRIARLETVSAIDLPLDDSIHIGAAGFPRLAERLARAADRLACGNRAEKRPPRLKSISPPRIGKKGGSPVIEVRFDDAVGGLRATGEPGGFAVTDGKGRDCRVVYKTVLDGAGARLFLHPQPLPDGACLSYGHGVTPACTIRDGRGCSLPVFGPLPLHEPAAYCPFVTTWRTAAPVSDGPSLEDLGLPGADGPGAGVKEYPRGTLEGFVNEHDAWQGRRGVARFAARMELPEPMRLEVLAGYDGPFRLWIDRKPFFAAPHGTNPCLPDEGRKRVALPAGSHSLHVAMDVNGGLAWGFFLRFRRLDVPQSRISSGDYARPVYSA